MHRQWQRCLQQRQGDDVVSGLIALPCRPLYSSSFTCSSMLRVVSESTSRTSRGVPETTSSVSNGGRSRSIANRAIWPAIHPLQVELAHPRLVRRDRRALRADAELGDGVCGVHRHLVVGRVAALDAEIEILQVDVDVRQNELILDEPSDDAGHLVPVELHDRGLHLDLRHPVLVQEAAGFAAPAVPQSARTFAFARALSAFSCIWPCEMLIQGERWRAAPPRLHQDARWLPTG